MREGEGSAGDPAFDPNLLYQDVQHLRLYIAGNTLRSSHAIKQLKTICEEHLPGRYTLEIVDIHQNGNTARNDHIVAVPTLLKVDPEFNKRLIGDLSDTEKLKLFLGVLIDEEPLA